MLCPAVQLTKGMHIPFLHFGILNNSHNLTSDVLQIPVKYLLFLFLYIYNLNVAFMLRVSSIGLVLFQAMG